MSLQKSIQWHEAIVNMGLRVRMNGKKSSSTGFRPIRIQQSTLVHSIEEALHGIGCRTFVFDGNNVHHGLRSELGFSVEDRVENICRTGETAKFFTYAGVIEPTVFSSPCRANYKRLRSLVASEDFNDAYYRWPLEICDQRD